MQSVREALEEQQIAVYFAAVAVGVLVALTLTGGGALEAVINPALALMLFATFLQVPLAELRQAVANLRFLAALLTANFIVLPLVVGVLFQFVPNTPLIQFGVLLVLLTPCIDYVVTFAYLGRADARLLLAATPALLIVQMLLLPVYLHLFLGESATGLVRAGPFVHAFLWIIALPLVFAGLMQLAAAGRRGPRRCGSARGSSCSRDGAGPICGRGRRGATAGRGSRRSCPRGARLQSPLRWWHR